MSLCGRNEDNCQDPTTLAVKEAFEYVKFVSEESLEQCTDYTALQCASTYHVYWQLVRSWGSWSRWTMTMMPQ